MPGHDLVVILISFPSKVNDEECKISPFAHASFAWAKSTEGTEMGVVNYPTGARVRIDKRLTSRGRDRRDEGERKGNEEFKLHVGVEPGEDLWGCSAFQLTLA
jgi:hypothetical protein